MPTAPGVAVVATDVAHADRRALSEAWFAALHLAHDDASPLAARRSPRAMPAVAAPFVRTAAPSAPSCPMPSPRPGRAHGAARDHAAPAFERRTAASQSVRRVERALERIAAAPRRPIAQTIAIDGGRVTLLVRSDARATRIVAVCSEALRPTVERALAHARFALVPTR